MPVEMNKSAMQLWRFLFQATYKDETIKESHLCNPFRAMHAFDFSCNFFQFVSIWKFWIKTILIDELNLFGFEVK
jgi:hypothetical protein